MMHLSTIKKSKLPAGSGPWIIIWRKGIAAMAQRILETRRAAKRKVMRKVIRLESNEDSEMLDIGDWNAD